TAPRPAVIKAEPNANVEPAITPIMGPRFPSKWTAEPRIGTSVGDIAIIELRPIEPPISAILREKFAMLPMVLVNLFHRALILMTKSLAVKLWICNHNAESLA